MMTNKVTLDENIQTFLNAKNEELWNAILENNIKDFSFSSPEVEDDIIYKIVSELFSEGKSKSLEEKDFSLIIEGNGSIVQNLARLIITLGLSDDNEELRLYIGEKTFHIISSTVDNIKEQAKYYPNNAINPLLWEEGVEIRSALNALIYYYKQKDNIEALHSLIMHRTQIGLAIMQRYKHIIGSDMIESAKIKEVVGDTETALAFYKAVDSNLRGELAWFTSTPEAGPSEEDVLILQSLKDSLQSIDRLSNTQEYEDICEQIEEVLGREQFEIPNFDDDEDDED